MAKRDGSCGFTMSGGWVLFIIFSCREEKYRYNINFWR